ncbi:MAG TPA: hypothetical protein VG870_12540 [Chitinophagaceae bacterium]|nr:hypothetical protein [Chitinophagaceae bacterium]
MNKLLLHTIVLLLLASAGRAQGHTTVRASLDRDSILIGGALHLQLQADIPENDPIRFFSLDSLPHFEILDRGHLDTLNTSNGTELRQTLRLTSFDSGRWVIPSLSLGGPAGPVTDSFAVSVGFTPFDTSRDYHDLKDILAVTVEKKQDRTWYLVGVGLLVLLLILYLLLRRRAAAQPAPLPAPPADPYRTALDALDRLAASWRAGQLDAKGFQSGLVGVFRLYLEQRLGLHSLQQTTDDLVTQLRGQGLEADLFGRLAQALRMSDLVKFAKYEPARQENEQVERQIREALETLEIKNRPAQPAGQ